MVIIGIFGVLFGVALSQYFKVFALAPLCVGALIFIIAFGKLSGHSLSRVAVVGAAAAIAIQLGYFAGLAVRRFVVTYLNRGRVRFQGEREG